MATEPEGVQYDRMMPHLVNLLQRQRDTIESQQSTIDVLEQRISALENDYYAATPNS